MPSDAHPSTSKWFVACTGDTLPASLHHASNTHSIHVMGCSIAPGSAFIDLTLCVETGKAQPLRTTHFMQSKLHLHPSIGVAGCSCGAIEYRLHVAHLRCNCERAWCPASSSKCRAPSSITVELGQASVLLQTSRVKVSSSLHVCTGRPLYGDFLLRSPSTALSAYPFWRRLGFSTWFMFARTVHDCNAVQSSHAHEGVRCQLRQSFDRDASLRTNGLYEQPVLNALCLSYSRTVAAEFLAFTDIDEYPPSRLPSVLLAALQHVPPVGGVRLFFDSEMSCLSSSQETRCPANESDYLMRCTAATSASSRRRNHWKPVVIPNRTRDVSVHQFQPVAPYVRKQVWSVCFHHRRPDLTSQHQMDVYPTDTRLLV